MFDVLQISWWFLQVTFVGYLCNYRVFEDGNDRLLFAPVSGLAMILIVSNAIWMWSVPTYVTTFILAASVGAAILLILQSHRQRAITTPGVLRSAGWLLCGTILIALHGSIIPFEQKVFQGYPIDRFGYLASYILFQQEKLSYFTDALAAVQYNGEKQPFFIHPMMTAALNEMQARTAAGLSFISLAWLTPRDLHQLANAWEVFLRVVQFSCVFALFSKVMPERKFLSGFLAIGTVFGYWFQYMKDFNSWPHMVTLALSVAIVALLISILNNGRALRQERYLIYLFALAMVVNHPEFGLVMCLGLGIVICSNSILRSQLLLRKQFVLEAVIFLGMIFLVHPYILSWLKRIFAASPVYTGTETYLVRGIYTLFGTDAQLLTFIAKVYAHPFELLRPVALGNITVGTSGFSYVSYAGSAVALGVALLLIALIAARPSPVLLAGHSGGVRRFLSHVTFPRLLATLGSSLVLIGIVWPSIMRFEAINDLASLLLGGILFGLFVNGAVFTRAPNLRILIVLIAFHFVFFVGSIACYRYFGILGAGSAYRSISYWSIFASMTLTLLLMTSGRQVLRGLAVGMTVANFVFGASIFWVTNHGGMERYANFYPNRDGSPHFGKAAVRDRYDFDYLQLIEPLRKCNLVFLDFKEIEERGVGRFQAANLMMFLDNNRIPVRLGFPYLNGYQLVQGSYSNGFKKEDVNPDCIVDQELRNGRLSYRLTTAPLK